MEQAFIACFFIGSICHLATQLPSSGTMLVLAPTMQNNFNIDYQGQEVAVEYQKYKADNEYTFTIQLPDGPLTLQCNKDNEGAYKWLQEDDSASEKATDIGTTIEKYMMENSINL